MILHRIRYDLNTLYYYAFENLTGDQRLAFLEVIENMDTILKSKEDF